MFLAKWGLHQNLSGELFTRLTDLNEIWQDCVLLNALLILKFVSKNIHKFLFGKRKLTKTLLMTLFTLRLGGCSGRSGTIFCKVCRFESNLVKLRQNDPLTRFESFLTVAEGVGKTFTFFWVVQFFCSLCIWRGKEQQEPKFRRFPIRWLQLKRGIN